MIKFQVIIQSVQKELALFDKLFEEALYNREHNFQFMVDFISGRRGKKIRPIILFLSAKLCGIPTTKTIEYAVIIELLHTSSLLHDDVIDNTMERRGQPSVNAQYNNKAAVLIGDFILSQAIIRGVNTENISVLKLFSNLAQNLIEGELIQLVASSDNTIHEKQYFEIIHKKTAVLISSCTELGAMSVHAEPEKVEILRLIGENLGICFQIKDDLFDYFEQGKIGKPTGNDIREGKITLPLIYALNNAPTDKSQAIREIIQNQNFNRENTEILISFAKEYNGIGYAQQKMNEIKEKTLVLLNEFPDSEIKQLMIDLIDYIIEREK
ncbi:MAG: polyprenyl synthetase family protein [Dysgonamonadaceae bacterium]|jgi:octaprenyl-diphosphate synthase|nr:polyprenyl synthetase family protein [Dysgonamonadaceae bacterium]